MKLNIKKVATFHRVIIDGSSIKFGWFESGKAFIAKDDELLSYYEALREIIIGNVLKLRQSYFGQKKRYDNNISGLVHYLIAEYCK